MSELGRGAFSRRALLHVAAAGSVAFLGTSASASSAAAVGVPSTSTTRLEQPVFRGFTDIGGVWAEYRQVIVDYPLSLPVGWSFPAESTQRDSVPGGMWEKGSGEAEAYFYWQRAAAAVAYEAHLGGDHEGANHLLDVLEVGYNSSTRRAVIEDPDNIFVTEALRPARSVGTAKATSSGDFSELVRMVGL